MAQGRQVRPGRAGTIRVQATAAGAATTATTADGGFDVAAPTPLVATRYVDGDTAAEIGSRLDAAVTPGPPLPRPCGTPTGTVRDLSFRANTHQVELSVEIGGCRGGTNGTWTDAWLGSDVEDYVATIVPIPLCLR